MLVDGQNLPPLAALHAVLNPAREEGTATLLMLKAAVYRVPSSFSRSEVQTMPVLLIAVISHHSRFSTPFSIQRVQSRLPATKYSFMESSPGTQAPALFLS